jgi:outer membrane protein assembly factor BamB
VSNDDPVDLAVGDIDGDGTVDVVHPRNDGFEILDPATGATKYSDRPLGPIAYFYDFQLANVDGKPGLEIVVTDTSYLYSPPAGIYVLGVTSGALTTLWSTTVSPPAAHAKDFYTVDGAVADLDGDGSMELVYSQWDGGANSWTTYVVNAATGATIAAIPGQIIQAVADVDGDGKSEIVVRSSPGADMRPLGTNLGAYDFDSAVAGPVLKSWKLASAHVVDQAGSVFEHNVVGDIPAIADFDPATPGLEMLVGVNQAQNGADTAFDVLRGDGSIAATMAVPASVSSSVLWWGDGVSSATSLSDVLVFGTDGTARALDHTLHQATSFPTGSYSNWLSVLGLDEAHSIVTMSTSEQETLGLDGTRLHTDGTPYEVLHATSVVDTSSFAAVGWPLAPIALLENAHPTLVHYEQGQLNVTLVGTDSTGVEIWRTPLAAGASVFSPGPYTYDFTGDGYPDLLFQIEDINQLASLAIFDGSTGALVRSTPLQTVAPGADFALAGSLTDVNGDGKPDLVEDIQTVGMIGIDLSASPMASLWTASSLPDYLGTVSAVAVDSTGTSLLRTGEVGPYARYSPSGTLLANNDEGLSGSDNETNGVAFVKRAGGQTFDMVAAGTSGAGLSRVRRIAGDTLAPVWTVYAAGGSLSASQPSPSFAMRDPLTLDADGDGTEEVVVGSDDGWVYAIHAADGTLLFSVNLGAPVSHLIAADVDLDPATELLASLGDGRLVALDDLGKYSAARDIASSDAGASVDAGAADVAVEGAADAAVGSDANSAPDATYTNDGGGTGPCGPTGATPPATHVSCAFAAPGESSGSRGNLFTAFSLLVGALVRRCRRGCRR